MITAAEVKRIRTEAGLTQTRAAATLGQSRERWTEYESGRRNMPAWRYDLFKRSTGSTK